MVNRSLRISAPKPQALLARGRHAFGELGMSEFKLGDEVCKDNGRRGVVRAIFLNREAARMCAVEINGALDFIEASRLSMPPQAELAA
jgi:hypothetical protein